MDEGLISAKIVYNCHFHFFNPAFYDENSFDPNILWQDEQNIKELLNFLNVGVQDFQKAGEKIISTVNNSSLPTTIKMLRIHLTISGR